MKLLILYVLLYLVYQVFSIGCAWMWEYQGSGWASRANSNLLRQFHVPSELLLLQVIIHMPASINLFLGNQFEASYRNKDLRLVYKERKSRKLKEKTFHLVSWKTNNTAKFDRPPAQKRMGISCLPNFRSKQTGEREKKNNKIEYFSSWVAGNVRWQKRQGEECMLYSQTIYECMSTSKFVLVQTRCGRRTPHWESFFSNLNLNFSLLPETILQCLDHPKPQASQRNFKEEFEWFDSNFFKTKTFARFIF